MTNFPRETIKLLRGGGGVMGNQNVLMQVKLPVFMKSVEMGIVLRFVLEYS